MDSKIARRDRQIVKGSLALGALAALALATWPVWSPSTPPIGMAPRDHVAGAAPNTANRRESQVGTERRAMEADARERVRAEEEAIALKTALAIANEWNLTPLAAEEASTVATHLEQSSRAWDRWKQDPSNTRELGKSQRLGVQVRDLKQVALRRALAKGLSFRCTRVLGPTDYEAARARGIEPEPFMGHGIEGITLIPLAGEPDLALALNALKARVAASPNPEKRQ